MMLQFLKIASFVSLVLPIILLMSCGGEKSSPAQTSEVVQSEESNVQTKEGKKTEKVILFFGNSLTAGYQLEEEESFPSLIQQKLNSLDLPSSYKVINAGLSGETSAGGLGRIDWVLKQDVDLFVLELGPNDALRGLDLDETEKNLRGILERVLEKHPGIPLIIAGMMAPPNMGSAFTEKFESIYTNLAKEFDAGLIPFLLEGVAGIPELNLRDGIHPNPEGQKIVAENVWEVLKEFL